MAFCRVYPLIKEGMALSFQIEIEEITPEEMVPRWGAFFRAWQLSYNLLSTLWKYQVYQQLLALSPGLEKRLCTATEEFIFHVADLVHYLLFNPVYFELSRKVTDTEGVRRRSR